MVQIRLCYLAILAIMAWTLKEVESRRRGGEPFTFGTMYDKSDRAFREGQNFMRHQINSPHKNKGWKHGRRETSESKSGSGSDEASRRDPNNRKSFSDNRRQQDFEKYFKEYINSRGCSGSLVYRKFLFYYKNALAILKQNGTKGKYETLWLTELANEEVCPHACPKNGSPGEDRPSKYAPETRKEKEVPRDPESPRKRQQSDSPAPPSEHAAPTGRRMSNVAEQPEPTMKPVTSAPEPSPGPATKTEGSSSSGSEIHSSKKKKSKTKTYSANYEPEQSNQTLATNSSA